MNDTGYYQLDEAQEIDYGPAPFNDDAEKAVIGGLLLDGDLIDTIDGILTPGDFYNGAHAEIFRAMSLFAQQGKKIDWLLLQGEIDQLTLSHVGGKAYGAALIDTAPATSSISSYAKLVRDKSILRSIARIGGHITASSKEEGIAAKDVLSMAEEMIFSVAEESSKHKGFIQSSVIMPAVLDNIERAARGDSVDGSVATGFKNVDMILGGLMPGNLYVLAARPAMGKTALAMNIVSNAAIRDHVPCGVFSLEMTSEQLMTRMLGSEAGVSVDRLIRGTLPPSEQNLVFMNAPEISEAKIHIDDSGGLKVSEVRSRARRLKREKGVGLIVIDYLGKIRGSNKYGSKVHEVTEVVENLKEMAKELNIPVIALAQLNRGVESRIPPIPRLSDLRDSGSIEQEADVVMFLYRPEVYYPDQPEHHGKAQLLLEKNRHGSIGAVHLDFFKESTRFDDVE